MSDEEFSKLFFAADNDLRKIKVAVQYDRCTIWTRVPPNFPEEYLKPILDLKDTHPVERQKRKSEDPGLPYVLVIKYEYREMGKSVEVYLKGYFEQDDSGKLNVKFIVQSLKSND